MDILTTAIQQGYLLHGSQHLVEVLEPRKARDEAKSSGNQNAVFATNNVAIAIWKAVAHKLSSDSMVGWSWNDSGEKILYSEGGVSLGNGYVYILPKESFQAAPDDAADYFTHTPVRPVQVVMVTPEELYTLQREINFTIDIR